MTDYNTLDFSPLLEISADEVVTHSLVRDVPLSDGRVLALVTLDNGRDHTRPNTLGAISLLEFAATMDELQARAGRGEIHGVAVTGKPFILAAVPISARLPRFRPVQWASFSPSWGTMLSANRPSWAYRRSFSSTALRSVEGSKSG